MVLLDFGLWNRVLTNAEVTATSRPVNFYKLSPGCEIVNFGDDYNIDTNLVLDRITEYY